jgi:hypothetical protein
VVTCPTSLTRIAQSYSGLNDQALETGLSPPGGVPCFTKTLMSAWTSDELEKIAAADELQLASARPDGTLRKPVTIWVVRLGDDLYVRSVNGRTSHWFRGTEDRREGHVRAGGVDKDVRFVEAGDDVSDEIETAYRTKYQRYGASYVDPLFTPDARAATLELVPRSAAS